MALRIEILVKVLYQTSLFFGTFTDKKLLKRLLGKRHSGLFFTRHCSAKKHILVNKEFLLKPLSLKNFGNCYFLFR